MTAEHGAGNGGPTPFELSLQHELDAEARRFGNEWLFRWHNINIRGNVVDVEDFFGGRIHFGGIRFEGQPQGIFWQSVEKYLRDEVHAVFERWDVATAGYPVHLRRSSLAGTRSATWGFVGRIIEHAKDTDRRLRGSGDPSSVTPRNTSGTQSAVNAEIERLKASHAALIPDPQPAKPKPLLKSAEEHFTAWRGVYMAVGLTSGIIFGVAKLLM